MTKVLAHDDKFLNYHKTKIEQDFSYTYKRYSYRAYRELMIEVKFLQVFKPNAKKRFDFTCRKTVGFLQILNAVEVLNIFKRINKE